MSNLLVNSIQCPDGTIIESRHWHDFVQHIQEDGRSYAVDGGNVYQRIMFSDKEFKDLSVYSDDPHELIRERFTWGTYGPDRDQPLSFILLKDMTEDHIQAILDTQHQITKSVRLMFMSELVFRGDSE